VSRKEITGFPSQLEAEAFVDGMYYVNDSALEDIEVKPPLVGGGTLDEDDTLRARGWRVTFEDTDYDEDVVLLYEPGNMGA
jgi:hypothetical protein